MINQSCVWRSRYAPSRIRFRVRQKNCMHSNTVKCNTNNRYSNSAAAEPLASSSHQRLNRQQAVLLQRERTARDLQ